MATQTQFFEAEQTHSEKMQQTNGKNGFESTQFSLQMMKENQTSFMIGWFYEILMRKLLGISISNEDMWRIWKEIRVFKPFDLKINDFWFEVKGFSNNDRIKYFALQLDDQLKELDVQEGKPINPIAMIFFYRNRLCNSNSNQRMMFHGLSIDDKDMLFEFLANQTIQSFAIDLRFLDVLRSKYGTRPYQRRKAHQVKESLNLKRRDLKQITLNTRDSLEDLGITEDEHFWLPPRAKGICVRRVETEVCGHKMSFELFPLLPISLRKKFFRMLNGTMRKVAA